MIIVFLVFVTFFWRSHLFLKLVIILASSAFSTYWRTELVFCKFLLCLKKKTCRVAVVLLKSFNFAEIGFFPFVGLSLNAL